MAANEVYTARTKWSDDMEDLLVDWWQQYECLYNVSSDTYHNKAEKERCWEEIAVALDLPVEDVKVRAATLRTQYSRLLKPLRTGKKNKAMTARQKRILKTMKFLKKHIIPRSTESNLDQSPKGMLSEQQDSDDSEAENAAFSLDLDSGRSHSPAENVAVVKTSWSVEKEDKFLELWQQHECLYNLPPDRCYDRTEREKKWAEIASALELPVEDVKTRATSLRTQYSKLVKPQRSGRKTKPMTARQRRILTSCEFLKKYINHRSNEESLERSIKDVVPKQESSDSEPENRAPSQDFDGGASPSPTESSCVSPPPPPPPQPAKKRPKTQNSNDMERQKVALLQDMLDVIQETNRQPERDCEDSFGVTVAMELKRIHNPSLRNRVKRQIMNILYDALDSEQGTDAGSDQPQLTFPSEESHSITVVIP